MNAFPRTACRLTLAAWRNACAFYWETTLLQAASKALAVLLAFHAFDRVVALLVTLGGEAVVINDEASAAILSTHGIVALALVLGVLGFVFSIEGTLLKRACCHFQLGKHQSLIALYRELVSIPATDSVRLTAGFAWRCALVFALGQFFSWWLGADDPRDDFVDLALLAVLAVECGRYYICHCLAGCHVYCDRMTAARSFALPVPWRIFVRRLFLLGVHYAVAFAGALVLGYAGMRLIAFVLERFLDSVRLPLVVSLITTASLALMTLYWCLCTAAKANLLVSLYYLERGRSDDLFAAGPKRQPHVTLRFCRRHVALSLLVLGSALLSIAVWQTGFYAEQIEDLDRPVAVAAAHGGIGRRAAPCLDLFAAAVQDGADYLVLDIAPDSAGRPAVCADHDTALDGAGRRLLELTTASYRYCAPSAPAGPFVPATDSMPTLDRLITFARDSGVLLLLHVKNDTAAPLFKSRLVEQLRARDFFDSCVIVSGSYDAIRQLRVIHPDLRLGPIIEMALGDCSRIDANVLCTTPDLADSDFIDEAHRDGFLVQVFRVDNDPGHYVDHGADMIITNDPARVKRIVQEKAARSRLEKLLALIRHDLVD